MERNSCCTNIHVDPYAAMSVALSQYHFSTPEIRLLMRHVLGHALSGRTIKRLARSAGSKLRRGRPPTTPRVQKRDVCDLIQIASRSLNDAFRGNVLHFFHQIQLQFGLTPRQYLRWATQSVRRGKCVMRRCLLCSTLFPSLQSGDRHCQHCKQKRHVLMGKENQSVFAY